MKFYFSMIPNRISKHPPFASLVGITIIYYLTVIPGVVKVTGNKNKFKWILASNTQAFLSK